MTSARCLTILLIALFSLSTLLLHVADSASCTPMHQDDHQDDCSCMCHSIILNHDGADRDPFADRSDRIVTADRQEPSPLFGSDIFRPPTA